MSGFAEHKNEPIAIIGVGCRYPGGVHSTESYWKLLVDGVDTISEVPEDRWNKNTYYNPKKENMGKTQSKWGGFLDRVDHFDAAFFGISPREAALMDPQQRLLLEICWEAMEDGLQVQEKMAGTDVGVFIGAFTLDYKLLQFSESNRHLVDAHSATGAMMTLLANRISYVYDFRGPSLTVDTACSSSLVAVHLACQSLWNGESSMAFAGGVNVIVKPEYYIAESKAGMLSPDGRSRAFDSRANGYVRGEGAGVILLKPLSKALKDGDPIHAVIRGTGSNQDGNTPGITVPRGDSQKQLIQEVYSRSGVNPQNVKYVEAHGTGTPVGDPIEANALGSIFGNQAEGQQCYIGSVKTNIGHTEAAAGIAGLIKAMLCLKNKQIPAHLHFENPNKDIDLEALGIKIPTKLTEWPTREHEPAMASVNSFGFGGTNAHVILQEYNDKPQDAKNSIIKDKGDSTPENVICPIVISARSQDALRDLVLAFKEKFAGSTYSLQDIGYSLARKRNHHDHRLSISAVSINDLNEKIDQFLNGDIGDGISSAISYGKHKQPLAFVFTGMGPQWWAMGRELLNEDVVFQNFAKKCDELFMKLSGWSLIDAMNADEMHSRMEDTEVSQPANFLLQVGLVERWKAWGIEPDAIVGHSAGEVAAAYCAGVLSLEDAIKVVYYRSHLQQRTTGCGRMAAVGLSHEEAKIAIHDMDQISIAAINSPNSVTLAGTPESLEKVIQSLDNKKIFYKYLHVNVPYHSHYMDPLEDDLIRGLKDIHVMEGHTPLYSTVTGKIMSEGDFSTQYWWKNVRDSVLFAEAAGNMIKSGILNFIEIGPHPVLASSLKECLSLHNSKGETFTSLRRKANDRKTLIDSLGAIYSKGYNINWPAIYSESTEMIAMPIYPWQRERYWQESKISEEERVISPSHTLLGRRLNTPDPTWENELDLWCSPFLEDHQIQGTIVYPGAAYVEMMLAAAKELFGDTRYIYGEDVKFRKALFLSPSEIIKLRLIYVEQTSEVEIYSQKLGASEGWTLHATGSIRTDAGTNKPGYELASLKEQCELEIFKEKCYLQFRKFGLEYGEGFQGIERLWQGEHCALAQILVPDCIQSELDKFQIHPAVLDQCFQVLAAALPFQQEDENSSVYMPVGVSKGALHAPLKSNMWIYASITEKSETLLKGDIFLMDSDGKTIMEILGCEAMSLKDDTASNSVKVPQSIYETQWILEPRHNPIDYAPVNHKEQGAWIVFSDMQSISSMLIEKLEGKGEYCYRVSHGSTYGRNGENFILNSSRSEDFVSLLQSVTSEGKRLKGIIYNWALDISEGSMINSESLNEAEQLGSIGILYLMQAITHNRLQDKIRVWVVTKGAQQVVDAAPLSQISQSPIWGLAKAIGHQEYMDQWGGIIDLDDNSSAEDNSSNLFEEVWHTDGEDHLAYRMGQRYILRLEEDITLNSSIPAKFRGDVSYLITGGFGGLGLLTSKWMIEHGARRLILMGRAEFPERKSWRDIDPDSVQGKRIAAVKELEKLGATIHFAKADVCNKEEIERAVHEYNEAGWPEIRGVIHAAGVARPQLLYQMKQHDFINVLRPKVLGGWNLHEQFKDDPLDFFILFSSVASIVVMSGQANYSAGNSFLDALAHYRRARGMHGLSINWGPWLESGMATQLDLLNFFDTRGLFAMTNSQGLEALNHILCQTRAQFTVLGADWPRVADKNYPLGNVPPLIASLVSKHRALQAQSDSEGQHTVNFVEELMSVTEPEERLEMLVSYLLDVSSTVLRMNRSSIEASSPLNSFGLDSMMAMELKGAIESGLQVSVAVVDLLRGVTTEDLAISIMEMLIEKQAGQSDQTVEELLSEMEELPEDMLHEMLSQIAAGSEQVGKSQ
ncbi:acyl transferase domain-containing protein/acyl carrier protein [Paenibacillus sp. 4624]|uniref:Type I polyketide synthase n=1 Tax=Paenibacillus amylolyticus TaxID=1451 RepID=A0A5M9WW97_PAEAM|nr:type I polyketide synthase [Paenibacillus amylolyticus]KAA8785738.1 type I polyketide synthase [Paenibacillus amylolyticus]